MEALHCQLVGIREKTPHPAEKVISGQLALPYREDRPAVFSEAHIIPLVTLHGRLPLRLPKRLVRRRFHSAETAVVDMPVAAVDVDYLSTRWEYHIRASGKVFAVETEPEPHRMHQPPYR